MKLPDIDIDTPISFEPHDIFPNSVRASRAHEGELLQHPCGYYFENIPVDKVTGLSAIPYKQAEAEGYFKIDLLHNHVYDHFANRSEIKELLACEPNWDLLHNRDNIAKLSQIKNQASLVLQVKPRSIDVLADTIALIRPGKRHLLTPYTRGTLDRDLLYTDDNAGYSFKKAHAIAYAHVIVLEMHLLEGGII